MKQHYRVSSVFRAKDGRELRRVDTFNDVADGPKQALIGAHGAMETLCAADPRIDSIASTCKGADGDQVSTTDYADELGCGTSSSGLMREFSTTDMETDGPSIEKQAVDAIMDERMKAKLLEDGKAKAVSTGGASDPDDPFRSGATGQGGSNHGQPAGHDAGTDPATAGAGVNSAGGNQQGQPGAVPHRQRTTPNGCPYLGKDIIGDLVRAVEETDRSLRSGRATKAIHVGRSAYDALVKEMEKQNRGMKIAGPISIAGVPVILHDDPSMPPIQVQTGKRVDAFDMMRLKDASNTPFANGGPVGTKAPDGRYYGVPAWLTPSEPMVDIKRAVEKAKLDTGLGPTIFIDEAADIPDETWRKLTPIVNKIADKERARFERYYLGKWDDTPEDNNE